MRRKKWVGALAVLTAAVASLLVPVATRAYNLEGPRWPGQPSPPYCCADIYWEQQAVFSKDTTALLNGATAWSSSAAYVIFYTSNVPNIYAETPTTRASDGMGSPSTRPTPEAMESKYFNNGTIVTLNYHYTQNYSANEAQSVAVHEFGHALGLAHSSTCVIMNGSTYTRYVTCGVYIPQYDDDNGVNALY